MEKPTEKLIVNTGSFPIGNDSGQLLNYTYKIDWYVNDEFQRSTHLMNEEYVEALLQCVKYEWRQEKVKGTISFAEKGTGLEAKVRNYE